MKKTYTELFTPNREIFEIVNKKATGKFQDVGHISLYSQNGVSVKQKKVKYKYDVI